MSPRLPSPKMSSNTAKERTPSLYINLKLFDDVVHVFFRPLNVFAGVMARHKVHMVFLRHLHQFSDLGHLVRGIGIPPVGRNGRDRPSARSTDSIELIRVVKNEKELISTSQKSITMKFKIDKDLNITNSTGLFVLESGDQIVVR